MTRQDPGASNGIRSLMVAVGLVRVAHLDVTLAGQNTVDADLARVPTPRH